MPFDKLVHPMPEIGGLGVRLTFDRASGLAPMLCGLTDLNPRLILEKEDIFVGGSEKILVRYRWDKTAA